MKKLILLTPMLFFGCSDPYSETQYTFINNTNHTICLQIVPKFPTTDCGFFLNKKQELNQNIQSYGRGGPLLFFTELTAGVIYDDTIFIIHGKNDSEVLHDLTKIESYTGGVISSSKNSLTYKYEYTFTEADYQEALERHLKGKKK